MFDTVRARLTAWYVSVLGGVLVLFGVGVYGVLARALHDRVDENLLTVLDVAATSLTHDAAEGQAPDDAARSTVTELSSRLEELAIHDGTGALLARTPAGDEPALLPDAGSIAFGADALFTMPDAEDAGSDDADGDHRVAARRLRIAPGGTEYVVMATHSLDAVHDELESLEEILLYAIPLAALAAGLGGYFLARKSLAPVVAMAEQARRMGASSLGGRLPVANPRDELGRLASAFNELLARLDAAFAQQRRFMADASHELRTPLAAVQAASDVTLQRPRRDEQEYREALAVVRDQARRLRRIVEDMFLLARADAGDVPPRAAPLYLDELVDEVVRAARLLAASRDIAVAFEGPPESAFVGDEDLLRRLVLNLVDNAIKHSPDGGTVRVSLSRGAAGYRLDVRDQGHGIPEDARARLFERFYRADPARSRAAAGADGSGAGLGLAIARWAAEAHGGSLELVQTGPDGSLFAAHLPAPPAS
jgi:heavy metal sensor kinase